MRLYGFECLWAKPQPATADYPAMMNDSLTDAPRPRMKELVGSSLII
jgi:hypothetical protein